MKLKAIFLIPACIAFSTGTHAQHLTLSHKNVSLTSVFKEIKKQTGFSFVYPDALVQKAGKVTVVMKNATLEAVLNECFRNQPLTYSKVNKMVIIREKEDVASKKTEDVPYRSPESTSYVNVKGRILNDSGRAIAGASINVQGLVIGTYSDGSRGAGGVIIITTKRGRTGKSVISYDSYAGVSEILEKYRVFNGQEYARFKEDAATYNRTNWPASAGTSSYLLTQAEKNALEAGISTDWQDLIYKRGFITNQQLSLSSGSETTQIGLSGGYFREAGIIPNQKFERFSIRATIDHKVGRFVRAGINTVNSVTYLNTPGGAGVPFNLVRITSLAAPYNSDGSVNLFPSIGSLDGGLVSPLNLKTSMDAILARNRRLRTINNLYTEVQITNGLKYRFNLGLDYRQENVNTYNGALTYTNPAVSQSASEAGLSNTESWSYNIQHLLYYDKTFAHKHSLGITGLFEVNRDHFQGSNFNVRGVPADYIQNNNFGLASGQITVNPTNTGFSEQGIHLYTYNGLNSSNFDGAWGIAYTGINTLNGVLQYGQSIVLPDATRKQYLAQARFLRAFWYFHLVQTFGDIPLHTTFITVPSQADSRQPAAQVYEQVINDLTVAAVDLPNQPTAPFLGKAATKPVALYLLAKVYLTRGWLNNSQADFLQAYSICSDIISNKSNYALDLWQDYGDAFNSSNDYGKETMFVSDHSNDPKYGQYNVGGGASGGPAQNLTPGFIPGIIQQTVVSILSKILQVH